MIYDSTWFGKNPVLCVHLTIDKMNFLSYVKSDWPETLTSWRSWDVLYKTEPIIDARSQTRSGKIYTNFASECSFFFLDLNSFWILQSFLAPITLLYTILLYMSTTSCRSSPFYYFIFIFFWPIIGDYFPWMSWHVQTIFLQDVFITKTGQCGIALGSFPTQSLSVCYLSVFLSLSIFSSPHCSNSCLSSIIKYFFSMLFLAGPTTCTNLHNSNRVW